MTDVGNEGVALIARGGEPDARLGRMSFQALMERGLLSQAEYADLHKVYSDPSFSYVTRTAFAAWGRRAS